MNIKHNEYKTMNLNFKNNKQVLKFEKAFYNVVNEAYEKGKNMVYVQCQKGQQCFMKFNY